MYILEYNFISNDIIWNLVDHLVEVLTKRRVEVVKLEEEIRKYDIDSKEYYLKIILMLQWWDYLKNWKKNQNVNILIKETHEGREKILKEN